MALLAGRNFRSGGQRCSALHCLSFSRISGMDVVVKTHAELMGKHRGWSLLRLVRADQSEQTGLLGWGALKLELQQSIEMLQK